VRLHGAIAEVVHNGLLLTVFDTVSAARHLPVWGSLKRRVSSPERRRYHAEHVAIVAALQDRDAEAAEAAMRAHLQNVTDNTFGRHLVSGTRPTTITCGFDTHHGSA
jgi:GntR family transcriptional regulator, uxu operon transcriptional repressor